MVWAEVEPSVPAGQSTDDCERLRRPWCPTAWIFAADAQGHLSANAVTGETTYQRTLVLDGAVTTYVPGSDEGYPSDVAMGVLMARSFQFLRQELQALAYQQGSADQLGIPPGVMGARGSFFRVSAGPDLPQPVSLTFGFNTVGDWRVLIVEDGAQSTRVWVTDTAYDLDLGAEWFVPYAWPHDPPYLPRGHEMSLDLMRHPDP